jgi:hypothetical protein
MAGFPRAGSTLLMNIFAQNPKMHPTPTSGLIASVTGIRDTWKGNDIYKSNGEDYIYPKIQGMMRNMIIGFYENEIRNKKIPIDKNRGWTGCIHFIEELFQRKMKILFPIRDVVDVLTSLEKINRKSTSVSHGDNGN